MYSKNEGVIPYGWVHTRTLTWQGGCSQFTAVNLLGVSNVVVSADASAGVTGAGEVCSFGCLDGDSSGGGRSSRWLRSHRSVSVYGYMIKKLKMYCCSIVSPFSNSKCTCYEWEFFE